MFPVEEAIAPDGRCLATICMREDGLFEGRLYGPERGAAGVSGPPREFGADYELCGVAATLPRIQTIVYEELGLTPAEN